MLHSARRFLKLRKTTGSFVVKRQLSPHAKLLVAGGVGAALIAGVLFIYEHGMSMAGFESAIASRVQQRLEEQTSRLRDENSQLRESLARAERAIQMDQTAYQDLDKALQSSAQEIVKLREELNFYRNIISPADKKGGLRIQSLDVQQVGAGNTFRYKLVLIQALKHDRDIHGTANLEISGMQDGQNAVLKVPAANERPISVKLKYFQDIEGKFDLPRGFQPRLIKVNVTAAGGSQRVEALYDWPQGETSAGSKSG